MVKLKFGDVILLRFPFTDTESNKRRPALVIHDYGDGDIVVCRITSQMYYTQFDYYLETWQKYGLKLPSVVRVNKIATLEKQMVENKIGQIEFKDLIKIEDIFSKLTK